MFHAGPAIHLVNLIPTAASLTAPSVSLVHEILMRAALPMDTIALAVCILDSLDRKFSLNWRLAYPLARPVLSPGHTKRHTMPAGLSSKDIHIDSVHPEVIILAALMIAVKFLEDCQEPTQYYNSSWGDNFWTCEQVNVTERCIMESLGYRILPLWNQALINDALRDMELAAKQASLPLPPRSTDQGIAEDHHKRSLSSGKAIYGLGLQLTPLETPRSEHMPYEFPPSHVENDRQQDFIGGPVHATHDTLQRPNDVQKKRFTPMEGLVDGIMRL
jgi:hypothetical protein